MRGKTEAVRQLLRLMSSLHLVMFRQTSGSAKQQLAFPRPAIGLLWVHQGQLNRLIASRGVLPLVRAAPQARALRGQELSQLIAHTHLLPTGSVMAVSQYKKQRLSMWLIGDLMALQLQQARIICFSSYRDSRER